MSDALDLFHIALRYSHIAAGFLGLAVFWIPVFARKGGTLHIRCGWVFAVCALYVGTTGAISSAWACIHPQSFMRLFESRIPPEHHAEAVANVRFFFAILGFLSLAALSSVVYGLQVVRMRAIHERLRNPLLQGLLLLTGGVSVALALYGGTHLVAGWRAGSSDESSGYYLPLVLGFVGIGSTIADLRYIRLPRPTRMAWWYKHMECMLGAGIAFHTAFLVFGMNRLFQIQLPGAWALVPWLLPTLIGLPASGLWIRYYRKKFHELPAQLAARAAHEDATIAG